MKRFLIVVMLSALVFSSCTDEEGAEKVLKRSGYTSVDAGGYDFFNGSKDDVYVTKFKATAPNGERVSGVVTKGWFKGSTIRLND